MTAPHPPLTSKLGIQKLVDEDQRLTAEELKEKYGGFWKKHPLIDVEDWKMEISNDETRLGYWEHVKHQLDSYDVHERHEHLPNGD